MAGSGRVSWQFCMFSTRATEARRTRREHRAPCPPCLRGSCLLLIVLALPAMVFAQGRGGAGAPQQSGRAGAIKDVTGYWVSVVAEHWHLRMLVPPKGNVEMLPVNAEARRVTNMWDPAKDEASGEACRSYGAPAIMRVPGRVHVTWTDDNTLKIDTDAGSQTRLLHFQAGGAGGAGGGARPGAKWGGEFPGA